MNDKYVENSANIEIVDEENPCMEIKFEPNALDEQDPLLITNPPIVSKNELFQPSIHSFVHFI